MLYRRYKRRRFQGRRYRRTRRYFRSSRKYPRTTRVRATKALRKTYKVGRSLARLRAKFDFQRYYNYTNATYYLFFSDSSVTNRTTKGNNSLLYKIGPGFITSTNIMPYWIRGTTTNSDPPQFNPVNIASLNEGQKPGQAISRFHYPMVQGGRFRCRNVYCRWDFRYADSTDEQQTQFDDNLNYGSVKIRLCVFTLYDQNSSVEYTASQEGLGDLTYTPIGEDNNNAYFSQGYFFNDNAGANLYNFNSPLMVMKNVGSTRLHKVYDKTFSLNKLKTSKICKVNLFKNNIMKFDTDYVPTEAIANGTLYMQPFQQIYWCCMIEGSYKSRGGIVQPQNGTILVNNQNVVIYYDT